MISFDCSSLHIQKFSYVVFWFWYFTRIGFWNMSNIFQFFISCFKHVSYRICIANFFKPIKIFKNKFNFNNYQKTIFRLGRSIALLVVSGCSLVHVVHIFQMIDWSTRKPNGQPSGWPTVTPKSMLRSADRAVDQCLSASLIFWITSRPACWPICCSSHF